MKSRRISNFLTSIACDLPDGNEGEKEAEGLAHSEAHIAVETDTLLQKIDTEFNNQYLIGRRLHWSTIHLEGNQRINYANIKVKDKTHIHRAEQQIIGRVPLTAEVMYLEWGTAFGKPYKKDTLFSDIDIELELIFLTETNKRGSVQTQVHMEDTKEPLGHLLSLAIFSTEGRPAKVFKSIVSRLLKEDKD